MEEDLQVINDFNNHAAILEFLKRINNSKQNRKKYQLINSGKEIGEAYNIKLESCLNGYNHPLINLSLKFMNMICDLDSTNMNIIEANEIWSKMHPQQNTLVNSISNQFYVTRLKKLTEYIIYDMHKFICEIISIVWIIKYPNEKKFQIYDIGSYLNIKKEKEQGNSKYDAITYNEFDNYCDFFQIINSISNANKHSPTNNETIRLGKYEILVHAVKMRDDTLTKSSQLFLVSLNELIIHFNDFYQYSLNLIDSLTKPTI